MCARFRVDEGFEWELFGVIPVRVLYTPGHARDSICLVFPDLVFTGDTLFLDEGGAGRDDLPGGDPAAHWESLTRLAAIPDGLLVHPAHDYRKRAPSSLGRQWKTNPCLRATSLEEYVEYSKSPGLGSAEWMKGVIKANYACARDPPGSRRTRTPAKGESIPRPA